MIVDCHTHIQSAVREIDKDKHLDAAETVNACLVLAAGDGPSSDINEELSEYINAHENKMIGFALVQPTKDNIDAENLNRLRDDLGLKGVVLSCASCGFHPAHTRAMQLYESAQEIGTPVFFHNDGAYPSAVLDYAQPYLLDEVARTFPDLKIVIGNMGQPFLQQTLLMVSKHKNVYADLTLNPKRIWQVYNTVLSAYESEVMDKLLFGSGFPSSNAGECIETLLGFNKLIDDTNLPKVPRDHIRQIVERDTLRLLALEH